MSANSLILARVYLKNTGHRVARQIRGSLRPSDACIRIGTPDENYGGMPLDGVFGGLIGWEPDKVGNFGDIAPNEEGYALFALRTKDCFPGRYALLLEVENLPTPHSVFFSIPDAFRIKEPPEFEFDPEEWFFHIHDPRLRWMFEEWAEAFFEMMVEDGDWMIYLDVCPLDHVAEERALLKRSEGCA
ncbi:MAG: hypothetical protein ACXABY_16020 [Candidatus Thorarchaeota archaeon]